MNILILPGRLMEKKKKKLPSQENVAMIVE